MKVSMPEEWRNSHLRFIVLNQYLGLQKPFVKSCVDPSWSTRSPCRTNREQGSCGFLIATMLNFTERQRLSREILCLDQRMSVSFAAPFGRWMRASTNLSGSLKSMLRDMSWQFLKVLNTS